MDNARHEWRCRVLDLSGKAPTVNEADAFAAGWRAAETRLLHTDETPAEALDAVERELVSKL